MSKHWNGWNFPGKYPILCTADSPLHHLQSWTAVTSWVFPREGRDKHETSLQPYQRVWNRSWSTFLWVRSRRKLQSRSGSGWVPPLELVTDWTSRKLQFPAWKQTLYSLISCELISSSWLVLREGVDGHTPSFSLRSFMEDPISFSSPFCWLWYTSGAGLSEVRVLIKRNITLYSWK